MNIIDLPILGICGFSGSGKTTLIEELLVRLQGRNLKIVVVKHSSKTIELDKPGKDSYRFFTAQADVSLHCPNNHFFRTHCSDSIPLEGQLRNLSRDYDLVIVEGYKQLCITKVLLENRDGVVPPEQQGNTLARFDFGPNRVDRLIALLDIWLPVQWKKVPLFGCILTGGKSSRMGRPKHLIIKDGKTWLESSFDLLAPLCSQVILAGEAEIPSKLSFPILADIAEVEGPLAGIAAALRWNPWVSWLIVACDLPDMNGEAISWLLGQRQAGSWAIFPTIDDERAEPLLAVYDFRILSAVEQMLYDRENRPSKLQEHARVRTVTVPEKLRLSWRNVNYPNEIESKHP